MKDEAQLRNEWMIAVTRIEVCEEALRQAQTNLRGARGYELAARIALEKFRAAQTESRAISDAGDDEG